LTGYHHVDRSKPHSNPIQIELPPRLDRSAATELKEQLDNHLDDPIELDGSCLEVISGLGLQLLHFAKSQWAKTGLGFEITNPSEPLIEALSWLDPDNQEQIGDFV